MKETIQVKPVFNLSNWPLDGDIKGGGFKRGELMVMASFHRPGPSYFMYSEYMKALRRYQPGTLERLTVAVKFLRYVGYSVKWDGTLTEPSVFWFNTEGNGDAEAAFISDTIRKDYSKVEPVDISEFSGDELYAKMKEAIGHTPMMTIDSISTEVDTYLPAANNNLEIKRNKNT